MENNTERTIFFTCFIDFPRDNATFAAGYEDYGSGGERACCYLIFGNGRVYGLNRDRLAWEPLDSDESAFIRDHARFSRRIGTPCGRSQEPIRWELGQYAGVRG